VEAGQAAGCRTVFVDQGYNERRPVNPDFTTHSLLEATPSIIASAQRLP
jgi:D-glycero-D-manno-heptose 1,7-bisphosphate phosphatase